ncbi:hypothetical protein NEOC65_001340 [Neochlamydia sp. AcF65]|nr:hypothetical protein [Neochlamydia sp. AcF65]
MHRWVENPYWQYFCGHELWHHALPIHPTSLINTTTLNLRGIKK